MTGSRRKGSRETTARGSEGKRARTDSPGSSVVDPKDFSESGSSVNSVSGFSVNFGFGMALKGLCHEIERGCWWYGCLDRYVGRCRRRFIIFVSSL